MLKPLAVLGGLALLATSVDFTVSPETRTTALSVGRKVTGFLNKNSQATDSYLKCLELQPKQPEDCKKRFGKNLKDANLELIATPKAAQDGGVKKGSVQHDGGK